MTRVLLQLHVDELAPDWSTVGYGSSSGMSPSSSNSGGGAYSPTGASSSPEQNDTSGRGSYSPVRDVAFLEPEKSIIKVDNFILNLFLFCVCSNQALRRLDVKSVCHSIQMVN
jgi:hypothetical protein